MPEWIRDVRLEEIRGAARLGVVVEGWQEAERVVQLEAAELRIKPWSRAKKQALIRGDWQALRVAAMPPSERSERLEARAAPRLRSGRTGSEESGK